MPDPDSPGPAPDPRETLLTQVLSGELSIDAEPVQAAMRQDPSLTDELRDLLALRDELAVAETAPDPADSTSNEPWPGADDAIEALVQQELGANRAPRAGGPRPAGHWRWTLVALAAAALLLAISFWPDGSKDDHGGQLPNAPDNTQLGAGELSPNGTISAAELEQHGLRWGDLGRYAKADLTLSVFAADGTVLVDEADVSGANRFDVPPTVRNQSSFRWRLTARPSGLRRKSWPASVTIP